MEPPRLPADLRGRQRPDRLFATVGAAVAAYRWVSRISGRRRPQVTEVDRNLRLVVERITVETEGVVSLRLARPDGEPLPAWRPGAHLDLVLPSGRVRQYSLCGDPDDRVAYRIAARRIPGGSGSAEVHGLIPGDLVTVRGPRNAFPFVAADSYLFIAGGIGITPILPMVHRAAAAGADWRLVYTGRTLDSMPFRTELATLPAGRIWLRPDTEYGMPAAGAELLEHAPAGATVYCCGPLPMITSVRLDLPGSPARAVHFERFSAPPIVDGKPFTIRLVRSGTTLPVPADRSALDVIREALPDVAYSCRQGFCRTCKVRVLAGAPDHRDSVLTGEERASDILICVSRAARGATLTLDL
ncbi:PDR/VanB family oxidoreductase [Amycolatopsis cihanbeyliensis]|uniref:PDR/VanB family oxidoreductase n=1 Tax=Amycolatopsis cihanbeyliensis TaxID=1128664 RepID=UPI00114ECC2A|nr:PDR/VanB family oxidoreductase [Amycolatopsis cihanbeyliensis]